MAQRNKPLVGLDIDPVGIHAVAIGGDGAPVIARAASAVLEPGLVRDGEIQDAEALGEAVRALFDAHRDLGRRVRIGIANQKVVVRTIELPPIDDADELAAAIRFQAQDTIPMPLDQAVLDHQVLGVRQTPEGPRQQVLVAAARADMIERVVVAARAAGLRLDGIDLSAFAMVRALAGGHVPEEVVLYAQVGGITNVAVARGPQCLFTRASGSGVEGLAIELAERRALTLEHARAWLVHVGLQQPVELVEGDPEIVAETRRVLQDGVRRIGAEIRQSLDFHHMQAGDADVARAVVTGPATRVPGFVEAIGAELGLACGAGVVGGVDGHGAGELTIATGLATGGAPGVNLLPADARRAAGAAGRSGGAVYAVLGALALALVLVTSAVLAGNSVTSRENELAQLTADTKEAEQTAARLAAYTEFAELREQRLTTVRSLAESRFDWASALAEVARTVPRNVWLTSLRGTASSGAEGGGGAVRTALNVPAVEVTGCTTSQARVATVMSAMRRIEGVQRVSLESSEKNDAGGGSGNAATEGGGGNTDDCRNGSPALPQFKLTVFFAAPAGVPSPAGPGAAPAPSAPQTAGKAAAPAPSAPQTAGKAADAASTPGGASPGAPAPAADKGDAQ